MAADPDRTWEPWRPGPGMHVRIRRSGECPSAHHLTGGQDDGCAGDVMHGSFLGVSPPIPGHPYYVLYDEPIPTNATWPTHIHGQRYAAIELEPVPSEMPDAGR